MRRAQSSVIVAAVLVILCIAMVLLSIIWLLLKPEMKLSTQPQPIQEEKTVYTEKTNNNEITCPAPYINIGNACCLDSDYNRICDKDEESQKQNNQNYEPICEYPYIRIDTQCCLDSNHNGRCDYDDSYNRNYNYNDRYNDNYNNDRFDAHLNSPFSLYDYGINSDEITLWIKNKESYIVIIKSIEIDDCENKDTDTPLEKNDKEKFDFSCDRDYNFDRDITIEYTKEGSNETLIAKGYVSRDQGYYN